MVNETEKVLSAFAQMYFLKNLYRIDFNLLKMEVQKKKLPIFC